MIGHQPWCDPKACTIAEPAQLYTTPRRHASQEVTVGNKNQTINLRLVQETGRPPEMVVSMAWNRSTVALDHR